MPSKGGRWNCGLTQEGSRRNVLGDREGQLIVEKEGYLTDLLTDRAVRFIQRHRDKPFFMYVAYGAMHWPWQRPDTPDDIRTLATWYDANREDYAHMFERVDQSVGQIRKALDRQGLTNNTLVIFTSDNGGDRLSRNEPLFHRKGTVWEGGTRVPGLVTWPGRLPAGKTSDQVAITMDFTATILSAAGTKPPAGRVLDGIDLLPILAGKEPLRERTLFWRYNRSVERGGRRQKAVRKGDWKYISDNGTGLLFNLKQDIAERNDVRWRHPEKFAELRALVKTWDQEMDSENPDSYSNSGATETGGLSSCHTGRLWHGSRASAYSSKSFVNTAHQPRAVEIEACGTLVRPPTRPLRTAEISSRKLASQ